ncbi:MAG: hypothetical protein AAF821_20175 [Cyanobacteria bacterium P01_D01_bin.156]
MVTTTPWQQVEVRFREIWGYDSFRPPQDEVIRTLLGRRIL